jgi:hypothetical protein
MTLSVTLLHDPLGKHRPLPLNGGIRSGFPYQGRHFPCPLLRSYSLTDEDTRVGVLMTSRLPGTLAMLISLAIGGSFSLVQSR